LRAELALAPDAATTPLFPHAFGARLSVTAGEALELGFEVANDGDAPFAFEVALHTYFAVADVEAVAIEGLGGRAYVDKVAGGAIARQGDEPLRIRGEVDRVYDGGGPVTIVDPSRPRPVRVQAAGAASTVVWNPGPGKARTLTDMPPDDFRRFVCVETGNIADRRVTIAPGGRHETSVVYGRRA